MNGYKEGFYSLDSGWLGSKKCKKCCSIIDNKQRIKWTTQSYNPLKVAEQTWIFVALRKLVANSSKPISPYSLGKLTSFLKEIKLSKTGMPFIHISMKIVKATFDIFGGDRYVTIVIEEIFRDKQGYMLLPTSYWKRDKGYWKSKRERDHLFRIQQKRLTSPALQPQYGLNLPNWKISLTLNSLDFHGVLKRELRAGTKYLKMGGPLRRKGNCRLW